MILPDDNFLILFLFVLLIADYSIEDALLRLPGILRGNVGEINIQGVGYGRYNVTVDGQRLGFTGLAFGREYDTHYNFSKSCTHHR